MNKQIIKDEIQWLLEAINEQYETIHRQGEKIPQIEFDILMENVRKFYSNMQLLQRLNDPHATIAKTIEPEKPEKQQVPEEKVVSAEPLPVAARVVEPPVEAALPPESKPAHFKPAASLQTRKEAVSLSNSAAKPGLIDLFAEEEPVFTIKLKEAREKSLGPKIPSERIENLKAAIVINDKFMFINELFEGNLRDYNEAIDTLNGFTTIDEAAGYLDMMRKKNFWDTGSNAFRKLKDLVDRRF
jgi:hypothetical protein